ncbi:pentapeptide repeat-containing protein [Streptosporangium sandarakinum]
MVLTASGIAALTVLAPSRVLPSVGLTALPDWARWSLAGLALIGVISLGLAVLLGPAARRLAGERYPLTQEERGQLSVTDRIEAVNATRQTLLQSATGLVVIGGVVFTALSLWYTARTLDTTQQGQITDRYTKAIEQLGNRQSLDVRLGGIYALQRLATDSPRDRDTIRNVLAVYVRAHDFCTPAASKSNLPKQCTATTRDALAKIPVTRPSADVFAALNIAPTLTTAPVSSGITFSAGRADFSQVRFPRTDLDHANLRGANLLLADLRGANLRGANLRNANLLSAELFGANLSDTDLGGVNLGGADLRGAYLLLADLRGANLYGANLRGTELFRANLSRADLSDTDLRGADLRGADLHGADLSGANLHGADLSGAGRRGTDLSGVIGMTRAQIMAVAKTDATTRF